MLRVGLTGGYATGKTHVALQFASLGCHVASADELGHAVLQPGGVAYAGVVQLFGSGILTPDGSIDRRKLGNIVFPAPEKLEALNAIVHPAVFKLEEQMMDAAAQEDPAGIFIVEAAILVETGRHLFYDRLILTTCDPEIQIARAMPRDNATREQALARIARQWPFERKREFASYIIDTTPPRDEVFEQVKRIHQELSAIARH